VNVVVIIESLQKLSHLGALFIGQRWKLLGDIAEFAGNN